MIFMIFFGVYAHTAIPFCKAVPLKFPVIKDDSVSSARDRAAAARHRCMFSAAIVQLGEGRREIFATGNSFAVSVVKRGAVMNINAKQQKPGGT